MEGDEYIYRDLTCLIKQKKLWGGGTRETNNPKYIHLCEFKFKET